MTSSSPLPFPLPILWPGAAVPALAGWPPPRLNGSQVLMLLSRTSFSPSSLIDALHLSSLAHTLP